MRNDGFANSLSVTRRTLLVAGTAIASTPLARRLAWAQTEPVKGGQLNVCVYANQSSLDPATGRSGGDHVTLWSMYDTLVEFEPETLVARPGLATSWDWPDLQTLVLNLREGVVFHDGTPFDAAAVKANLERMMTDPRSTVKADVGSIESVEVLAANKVALHLKQPDTALPLILSDRAGMMASPKAFTEMGPDFDRHPVGTGQMRFVRWDDANQVVTERNTNYWREGLPHLDGITFKVMTDTNTGLRSVLAGQNNFIFRVPPQQVPNVERQEGYVLRRDPQLYVQMVYFNYSRPPMDDVRIRQAMNYAIDKDAYNKVVTAGLGEIGHVHLPKSHWAHDAEAAARYTYDPDRARHLLKEAGFPNGLELHSNHFSDQLSVQRMEIIAAMFGQVGITLKNTVATLPQSTKTWNEGVGDIHLSAWTGRADPSLTYALLFLPTGYFNKGGAEPSPELTKAINDSRSTTDVAERKEAFSRIQRLEREFALCLPLVFEPQVVVHHQSVKGFQPNLIGKPRFDGMYIQSAT